MGTIELLKRMRWPFATMLAFLVGWALAIFVGGAPFLPHGHCYLGNDLLKFGMVATNLTIWLAYMSISATLMTYYLPKYLHVDSKTKLILLMFAMFIFLCGMTHFSGAISVFYPWYWGEFWINTCCAIASAATAIMIRPNVLEALHERN